MSLTKKDIQTIRAVWHGNFNHRDPAQMEQAAATYDNLLAFECSDGGLGVHQPVTLQETSEQGAN